MSGISPVTGNEDHTAVLFDLAWVGGRLHHDEKEAISMAKRNIDPVLQQLVRAINESGHAATPITVSVHGTMRHGVAHPGRGRLAGG